MYKAIESEHITKQPTQNYKAAVGIVFDEGGNILLGLCTLPDDRKDKWCFPGGGIEKGENVYQAAKREIKEETGINTKPLSLSPIIDSDIDKVIFIVLKRTGGSIKPNEEFSDVDFFPIDQLPKDIYKQNKRAITQVKRLIQQAVKEFTSIRNISISKT